MRRCVAAIALLGACGFSNEVRGVPIDALPDAGVCTSSVGQCMGDILRDCPDGPGTMAVDVTCAWGCLEFPLAHCGELDPYGGGVMPEDVRSTDLVAVTLNDHTIDGDNGRIGTNINPTLVRGMGQNIINGIDFQMRANNISVFRFRRLTIDVAPTATDPALRLTGTRSIALVADEGIVISGLVDARGACTPPNPGPGGKPGRARDQAIAASGGNGAGTTTIRNGGGGGGHAGTGGTGRGGALGGGPIGDEMITILAGGGGGGGGNGGNGGPGGGGGGAIQLVSNGTIEIRTTGGINAGGCGGGTGVGGDDGGGGGGAGGAILLEAKVIVIDGVLAANGGGGGGGDANPDGSAAPGEDGRFDDMPAAGFGLANSVGGIGSAKTMLDGSPTISVTDDGGAGGGAAGRIRINTVRGMPDLQTNAVISPSTGTTATTFGKVRLR